MLWDTARVKECWICYLSPLFDACFLNVKFFTGKSALIYNHAQAPRSWPNLAVVLLLGVVRPSKSLTDYYYSAEMKMKCRN